MTANDLHETTPWQTILARQGFATDLVQHLAVPAFAIDATSRIIVWNQACEHLTGMKATEIIGRYDYWRAFYGAPRPCLADLIAQDRLKEISQFYVSYSISCHMHHTGEECIAHSEGWCVMPLLGTERYLLLDAAPIRDEVGNLIAVVETLRDHTDRKQAETKLILVASVFENSQEGILITDPQARIIDVNAAFTKMTGYTKNEVIGRTPAVLKSNVQDIHFYRDLWQRLRDCGQWRGEIWNRKKSGEIYPEILHINAVTNNKNVLTHYIGMFLDITTLKNTQQRLETLAHYDALTNLPNRVLFAERLHQALIKAKELNQLILICFLDLDNFKFVNDRYGHEIGDLLLIETAKRLQNNINFNDTVARLGGDEFALLINNLQNPDELNLLLEKLLTEITKPLRCGEIDLVSSASIGVTIYPIDDNDPDTLLRHADQAMYQAKQTGRNRYYLFDPHTENAVQNQHREFNRIRQALQHGELRLYYQPKVNMRTGEIVGMEALVRWQHPERGIVSPGEFLPLIEQSKLIIEVGEWVLREALDQIKQWIINGRTIPVSINIAANHFQHLDFVTRLEEILSEYPEVSPQLLELEILESTALGDIEVMRTVMAACQTIGVTFALDDFGTGYSSLSHLKQLPADTLKIDQSFVRDMLDDQEDLAIIEGVISLAKVFKKQVIAEGVESAEHGLLLMRYGCDYAQGFGIGHPMPAEKVLNWIDAFTPDWKWGVLANKQADGIDLLLLLAQYENIKWIQKILDYIEGKSIDVSLIEFNPYKCRFGIWYQGVGKKSYHQFPEYIAIDPLHQQIHQISKKMVQLYDSGQKNEARARIQELMNFNGQILHYLDLLQESKNKTKN